MRQEEVDGEVLPGEDGGLAGEEDEAGRGTVGEDGRPTGEMACLPGGADAAQVEEKVDCGEEVEVFGNGVEKEEEVDGVEAVDEKEDGGGAFGEGVDGGLGEVVDAPVDCACQSWEVGEATRGFVFGGGEEDGGMEGGEYEGEGKGPASHGHI